MDNILYIDDEQVNLDVFEGTFQFAYNLFLVQDTREAFEVLKKNNISVVITDQRMPEETGIEFIERVQGEFPDVVFMILSGFSDFSVSIKAIESGRVYRFLQKPWDEKQLTIDINNAIEKHKLIKKNKQLLLNLENQNQELKKLKEALEDENRYLKTEIGSIKNFENIITQDPAFIKILKAIEEISNSDASVLITGETGTGKELIALAIHNLSTRKSAPFIAVNCAAIPETLFESELFGHEKGAFTGAIARKKGKFELANNGTLFLDEIGEIPLSMQAKLLRAIQEGSIERVGGTAPIKLNLRIISATNRNLEEQSKKEEFRSDLFYRLNVFPIALPSLRERIDDIPLLVDFFVEKYKSKYNKKIVKITQKNIANLRAYNWPGNIRELENIVERAVITSKNGKLSIPEHLFKTNNSELELDNYNLIDNERKLIVKALNKTNWKISGKGGATELLGIPRTTLQYRIEKLKISHD